VFGIHKQLGLREKDIAKVQTGGPDLSSNEILLSSEKTTAIIDCSHGVLVNSAGINGEEFIRLTKHRLKPN
jgi:glutamate dehydrogenase